MGGASAAPPPRGGETFGSHRGTEVMLLPPPVLNAETAKDDRALSSMPFRRSWQATVTPSDPLLVYGATGYSGRLIAGAAAELGLRPVLAGRDAARLASLAAGFGLEYRVASLSDSDRLDAALRGVRVVVNAAGPFSATSRPVLDACLRTGTHYLDITGEVRVIEALAHRDEQARKRGIMVMPGVGFDVVAGDCLAAHVARRLPGAEHLALGVSGLPFISRGTARTLAEMVDHGFVRRDGALTPIELGSLERRFDFGVGARPCLNVSWGDVATAYYTTGIPNIEVYHESSAALQGVVASSRYFGWLLRTAPWQALLGAHVDLLPEGPTREERARARAVVVAEA